MVKLREYFRGETVEITGTVTDHKFAAANPTESTVIRIMDPHGVRQKEDKPAINEGTGAYYYPYDIPDVVGSIGPWTYEVIATDDPVLKEVSIGGGSFMCIERVA